MLAPMAACLEWPPFDNCSENVLWLPLFSIKSLHNCSEPVNLSNFLSDASLPHEGAWTRLFKISRLCMLNKVRLTSVDSELA